MRALFWAVIFFVSVGAEAAVISYSGSRDEVLLTMIRFEREVGGVLLDEVYREKLGELAAKTLATSSQIGQAQFFLLVDRNPRRQIVSLAFYDPMREKKIFILGSEKTSTGNSSRRGFYQTPAGIFRNTPANPSYRALGTRNSKGWRGLGVKGSRVWDLGWQKTLHPGGGLIDIRLLVHATDPIEGEKRLGKVDSKGCIRITAKFNRFLDQNGLLDAEFEHNEKASKVLLKDRTVSEFAGSLIVVVDSGTFTM